jgi:repressor LexA
MAEITDTQRRVLDFIRREHERCGIFPTVREIMAHMGFRSTNTVDYHVRKLELAGAIERRGRLARTFRLLGDGPPGTGRGSRSARGQRPGEAGIPIVGRVAAGEPILAEQNHDGSVNFRQYFHCDESTFALRVQGESMVDAGIMDGDLVIVRAQASVANGEIGVAVIGDEATVKRIYDEKSQWRLQPENTAMKPITVKKGDGLFRIAGKVIGVIRRI